METRWVKIYLIIEKVFTDNVAIVQQQLDKNLGFAIISLSVILAFPQAFKETETPAYGINTYMFKDDNIKKNFKDVNLYFLHLTTTNKIL